MHMYSYGGGQPQQQNMFGAFPSMTPMHQSHVEVHHLPQTKSGRCIPNWCRTILLVWCLIVLYQYTFVQPEKLSVDVYSVDSPQAQKSAVLTENSGEEVKKLESVVKKPEPLLGPTPVPEPVVPTPSPTHHKYFVVVRADDTTCEGKNCGTGNCVQPSSDQPPMCECPDGTTQSRECGEECLRGFGLVKNTDLATTANTTEAKQEQPKCQKCTGNTVSTGGIGVECVECTNGTFANAEQSECGDYEQVSALAMTEFGGAMSWWMYVFVAIVILVALVSFVLVCRRKKNYNGDGEFQKFHDEYSAEEVSITEPSIFIASDNEMTNHQILGADSGSDDNLIEI